MKPLFEPGSLAMALSCTGCKEPVFLFKDAPLAICGAFAFRCPSCGKEQTGDTRDLKRVCVSTRSGQRPPDLFPEEAASAA
jgi:hypothetical protein